MRCHFKQFEDAYDILWEFLVRHQDPEESEIYFSETLENMSDDEVVTLAPNEKIHQNNLTRIKNLIYEKTEEEVCAISDAISVESLENIGYTDEFCRKLFLIHDNEMRDILQRDLRECAIAVVAGQDKAATIMCGSIIEALLMLKIKERGISKYDVSAVSKGKTNHPVSEMSLNELLYIADSFCFFESILA